jgi:hypothetical protein
MLSRILWILAAGVALIGGMVLQDGDRLFDWTDHHESSIHEARPDEDLIDRAIDRSFNRMQVVNADGQEIEVSDELKRAMAEAVGRLVKAETDLAIARIGDDDLKGVAEAQARRNQARADVDRLKSQIRRFERTSQSEHDALREEIRREIHEDVRDTVRDAVRS